MMNPVTYAIGDVHGRDDLLGDMHSAIQTHHEFFHDGRDAVMVHIGDYIDRGPDSARVIDRLMRGLDGFSLICLKGNHEAMMLDCLGTDDPDVWRQWLGNGGNETLLSLGVSMEPGTSSYPTRIAEALGPERLAWLRALALYHATETHLYVHAGIRPGVPIEAQHEEDMLWIRGGFLDSTVDHGRLIIHGHTPTDEPELRSNRIGIDTGAPFTGRLTAVVLSDGDSPQFLYATGPRG